MININSISENNLGFFELDSKGYFTYIDERLINISPLYHFSHEETSIRKVLTNSHNKRKWELFKKLDSEKNFTVCVELNDQNGKTNKYSLIINKILKDKKKRYLGYVALRNDFIFDHVLDDNSTAGMALHKIILDKNQRPIDYVFIRVNKTFRKLLGLHSTKIVNKKVTELFPKIEQDSFNWIGHYGRVALTGDPMAFEQYSSILKRWYYVTAYSPFPKYFLAIFHDITDKKNIEKKLEKAQMLAQLGHFEWIPSLKKLNYSQQFKKFLDLPPDETLTFKKLLKYIPQEEMKKLKKTISRPSKNKTSQFIFIHKIQTKDVIFLQAYYEVTKDHTGMISLIFCTIQNITQQKKTENVLKKLQEKARQSDLLKTRLLSTMGHEIRNQLNILLGITEIKLLSHSSTNELNYLKEIWQASSLISKYVDDILDFSKTERKSPVLNCENFHLYDFLYSIKNSFKYELQKNDISLFIKICNDISPHIYTDKDKIRQILENLILNSIKFTPKGSITISVKKDSTNHNFKKLLFSVSDTGQGIDPKIKKKIFKEFVQKTQHHSYKSSGLGLFICKNLVNILGGEIWVSKTSIKGTTFSFNIKYQPEKKIISNDLPFENTTSNNITKKILIIDNNELATKILSFFVNKMGHHAYICKNYQEAIHKIEKYKYNFLLIDIELSYKSGFYLAQKIRKGLLHKNKNQKTPIILISGHPSNKYKFDYQNNNIDHYLQKPVNFSCLKNIIENYSDDCKPSKINPNSYQKNIIKIYLKQFPKRLFFLNKYFKENNLKKLAYNIHELKNSTSLLTPYTYKSYKLCQRFEFLITNNGPSNEIANLFSKLIFELKKESAKIQELIL